MAQTLSKGQPPPSELDEVLEVLVERAEGLARLVQRFEAAVEAGLTEWAERDRARARRWPRPTRASSSRRRGRRRWPRLNRTAGAADPRGARGERARVRPDQRRRHAADLDRSDGGSKCASIDQGRGIDPDATTRIFDPLEQAEDLQHPHPSGRRARPHARPHVRPRDGRRRGARGDGPEGSTFLWTVSQPGADALL